MTRSELALILLNLVQRKAITPEEMVEVLRRFDAGDLDEDDLPLTITSAEDIGSDNWTVAAALVYVLLSASPMRPLSRIERDRARTLLRMRFEANMVAYGAAVYAGGTIARWHSTVANEIATYARMMTVAGTGKIPIVATQAIVEERLAAQWSYLKNFATQIMARQIGGRDMSELWIAQRSKLYGGAGWASYFQGQGSIATPGYVDVWLTRDDPNVCDLCFPRHQRYFLPTQGPWPGESCRGSCRCRREPEYLPDIYADLSGMRSSKIHPFKRAEIEQAERMTRLAGERARF